MTESATLQQDQGVNPGDSSVVNSGKLTVANPQGPSAVSMIQFFQCDHLPEHLKVVSQKFKTLAEEIYATLPSNPERTVAVRKLLEAKDCAVRAVLFKA